MDRRTPVSARIREIVRPAEFATHTYPLPSEIRSGSGPVWRVPSTLRSSSLSRYTTPSGTLDTQTNPRPTARSLIQPSSLASAVIRFATGSILRMNPTDARALRTAPSAYVSHTVDSDWPGLWIRAVTRPLSGFTRTTLDPWAIQSEPPPNARPPPAWPGTVKRRTTRPLRASMPTTCDPASSAAQTNPPPDVR